MLLCLVSAAVLVSGCTSQTSGSVTTLPTTMVPAPVTTIPSGHGYPHRNPRYYSYDRNSQYASNQCGNSRGDTD